MQKKKGTLLQHSRHYPRDSQGVPNHKRRSANEGGADNIGSGKISKLYGQRKTIILLGRYKYREDYNLSS